jgi:glucose-6-phosphate 1-dehydrogenase
MQTLFDNPLKESNTTAKNAEPCVLVIFGATGDLTARKLVPALYNLSREGQQPSQFACVGFARRPKDHAQFRSEMQEAVGKFSRAQPVDQDVWDDFSEQMYYHESSFDDDDGYIRLKALLEELDQTHQTRGNRVFYLSTQPSYFPVIIQKLSEHGLTYDPVHEQRKWSRVIIEKPFGHDYDSALELQRHIDNYLHESQIYRIDHYLGKETVQNLLVFRFANSIFESLWNSSHIDHVQITVAEDIGIGSRGAFFEEAGLLRDVVQNHVMQLLCLVAMEPPVSLRADAVRDEKVKVLESIRPIDMNEFGKYVVRGQYAPGFIGGKNVAAYRQEQNVDPNSKIETYVGLQLFIDNWRWAGVPFYIRGGKRFPKRATEIAIVFKEAPGVLFQSNNQQRKSSNVLVMRIQPNEGISLRINSKVPGMSNTVQPVKMDFHYGSYFGSTPPEAYERLIGDCMSGDSTLFARSDEVLSSWKLLTPVLERWADTPAADFPNYQAGTWGPQEADHMLAREGRQWRLL